MQHIQPDEDGPVVSVTRHAAQRFMQRVRPGVSIRRAARLIERAVLRAINAGELIQSGSPSWLAPLWMEGEGGGFALLHVRGPPEKPFRVDVLTVISDRMAMHSHGHLVGVGCHALT
jgi:hypothetical protein